MDWSYFVKILRPYQKDIIRWGLKIPSLGLCPVDMRLGKSLCAIRFTKLWDCKHILIVAPYSAIYGWEDELKSENINFRDIGILTGEMSSKEKDRVLNTMLVPKWLIVNKEIHRTFPNIFRYEFDCIILDESSFIANPSTDVTKFYLKSEWQRAKHRIILSGTPATENPLQYYCQIKFLDHALLKEKNYWDFRMKWFKPDGFKWKITEEGKKYLASVLHKCTYSLSRKDVHLGGIKIYEQRYCELGKEVRAKYNEVVKSFSYDEQHKTIYATQKFLWLREFASGFVDKKIVDKCKIDMLVNLCSNELKEQQVVIWCNFLCELDLVWASFHTGTVEKINGSVNPSQRAEIVRKFQEGKIQYLCIQPETMKFGSKLTAADCMVYFSSPLSGLTRQQTEDRTIDVDKKDSILIIDLITKDTVDEDIYLSLIKKESQAQMMTRIVKRMAI
jgi:SNF2 family DNA or RNA helicase